MEFNKYKEFGAYHHRLYAEGKDPYVAHANRVAKWITPGRTLDVGAGDGLITSLIPLAIGIDDNKEAVALAKAHGIDVKLISIYNLRCPYLNYFDNVFLGDVIEHLEFPDKAIKVCKNVLKGSGHLYVSTIPAIGNGILHDMRHFREYNPDELKRLIEPIGFRITEPITIANDRMYAKFRKL